LACEPALCVCGLAAEARIARRAGFAAVVGADDLPGPRFLVSFGIAGALDPGLRPGDVILTDAVIGDAETWRGGMQPRLGELARRIGAHEGPVFGASGLLATPGDKARAWQETGAAAVDLESAAVARAAAAAGIRFAVLRAVADPAERGLPPAALLPLTLGGRPRLGPVFYSVLRRPGQIPGLVGLARETRRALAALVGPARALHGLLAAL
jgi:adenosylhomocysteine nucleosidase